LSPNASELLVKVNKPKALPTTKFLVTNALEYWRGIWETKTPGKSYQLKGDKKGSISGALFLSLRRKC
jgi:hypothetical protein